MNSRPMLQESQGAAPGAAAKQKRKPSAAASNKTQKPGKPSGEQENQPKKAKKAAADAELEALEIKRKALVMKNKWAEKLEELIAEVSLSIKRAEEFSDCDELLALQAFVLAETVKFPGFTCLIPGRPHMLSAQHIPPAL